MTGRCISRHLKTLMTCTFLSIAMYTLSVFSGVDLRTSYGSHHEFEFQIQREAKRMVPNFLKYMKRRQVKEMGKTGNVESVYGSFWTYIWIPSCIWISATYRSATNGTKLAETYLFSLLGFVLTWQGICLGLSTLIFLVIGFIPNILGIWLGFAWRIYVKSARL